MFPLDFYYKIWIAHGAEVSVVEGRESHGSANSGYFTKDSNKIKFTLCAHNPHFNHFEKNLNQWLVLQEKGIISTLSMVQTGSE